MTTRRLSFLVGASCAIALCITAALPSEAADDGDLAQVPAGVVHFFVQSQTGARLKTGSGFLINGRTLVTNHHVVTFRRPEEPADIYVMNDARARELSPGLSGRTLSMRDVYGRVLKGLPKATVLWSDEAKDLAVVTLDDAQSGTGTPLPLTVSTLVRGGDRVVAFGFPGVNLNLGAASLVTIERRPGEINSAHEEPRYHRHVYTTSMLTYKGMSGGPAVNHCGEVAGIVVGSYTEWIKDLDEKTQQEKVMGLEELHILIQTDTLVKELERLNVSFTKASTRCKAAESSGTISVSLPSPASRDPLLTGGVIAALVLGLIAVVLGATKRGRNAVKAATDSVSKRLSRRDDRAKNGRAKDGAAVPIDKAEKNALLKGGKPAAADPPLLFGVSGEYLGIELELGRDPIRIGRDPRLVHLVFSPDASIVSGRHCAVWFDADQRGVMVEDLWSTNGTYLGDGRRLPGGVPHRLRSADQFYLGDPDVLFEVRY